VRLRLMRLEIRPHFVLVGDDAKVVDEATGAPFNMYPGKFIPFEMLCERLEEEVNAKEDEVKQIAERSVI
jgi:hypothetical protein